MEIKVFRYNSQSDHTNSIIMIDGAFGCDGLEDEARSFKVFGETCVSDGIYPLGLRTEGGFHQRYLERFGPEFHKGMLHVMDVPDFEYVLIHIGNDDDDTAGCLLVGQNTNRGSNFISNSKKTYMDIYPRIAAAILDGECVTIEYITLK